MLAKMLTPVGKPQGQKLRAVGRVAVSRSTCTGHGGTDRQRSCTSVASHVVSRRTQGCGMSSGLSSAPAKGHSRETGFLSFYTPTHLVKIYPLPENSPVFPAVSLAHRVFFHKHTKSSYRHAFFKKKLSSLHIS